MIKVPSKNLTISGFVCMSVCAGMGLSLYATADGNKFVAPASENSAKNAIELEANVGLQQTLNLNFSPENREKLRKALDDYARSVDQDHAQIEERRRAMRKSIEARFLEADTDGDGTVDRQEATEKLPQIARHFDQVDTNHDNMITMDELEEAQSRMMERRRAAEATLEAVKSQEEYQATSTITKGKNKQAATLSKKGVMQNTR